MARLPDVLGTDDLPLAELCAARIDGEVMAIRGGFVPIDAPDLPAVRAQILALDVEPELIIDRRSAAWIHGAGVAPPPLTTFCVDAAVRSTARFGRGRIREVRFEPGEVVEFGRARCTSRLRTAYDLLRAPCDDEAPLIELLAELLHQRTESVEALGTRLELAFRLPHKQRALDRLAAVRAALPSFEPSFA